MINDNDNLLEILKSSQDINKSSIQQPKPIKAIDKKAKNKSKSDKINKSVLKARKFDFMVDPDLVDYLDHQIFITGIREKKDYINYLIRQDLKKRLNISDNQDLIDEWLNYKDNHIPKGLK